VAWLEWGTWSGYTSTVRVACDAHKTVTSVTYPLRWRWFTKARFGTNTTTRSHSGSCYMNRSYYPSGLHLDCWGGSYAQATYRFALPSDARRISRNIRTEQGCCASLGGSTSKRWSGNTAIVRATGWAGIYVKRVSVEYQHRVKVRTVTTKELTTRLTTTF
jgi:hypothetical protein